MGRAHMPVRLYMTPMTKDGAVVGAVALVEDITELRRLEQVRTDFAANVSHELKTPLTSIKGFVETLQNGAIANPETAQKFLKIIMLEADRLTRLINDSLSISKLESGADNPPRESIRLDKMAHEISEMLSILASEKDVTIRSRENAEPSYVYGNPDQMEQMLINLIENAIKYNRHGGSVNVSVFNNEKTVNLLISDTGIGIPEEHLPRLFERFYRVDKGRSRSMGGTGLGLAIVKHIASNMGAMIEVHSKFGEGTEFLITFPSARPPEKGKTRDQGRMGTSRTTPGTMRRKSPHPFIKLRAAGSQDVSSQGIKKPARFFDAKESDCAHLKSLGISGRCADVWCCLVHQCAH